MKKIFFEKVPTNIVKKADNRLLDSPYVIFDIETTGLNPIKDKIIQFGGIKFVNNNPVSEIEFFIDPECEIPKQITAINNITNKDVANQLKIKQGLIKIIDFFEDAYLIAHNGINFDACFINAKLKQNKMGQLKNPILDTMWLSKAVNLNFKSHSLKSIVENFQINYDESKAHQALYDTKLLSEVWKKLKIKLDKDFNLKELKGINKKFVKFSYKMYGFKKNNF